MFWKTRVPVPRQHVASLPNYVIEKIAQRHKSSRNAIINTASKRFHRSVDGNLDTRAVEKMLLNFGRDSALLASLTFAASIAEVTSQGTSEIEYGDYYAAALFCLATSLRTAPNRAVEVLISWRDRFRIDIDYLVFAAPAQLDDLAELGWETFQHYHDHQDSILPRAYLHLLAQIISHRRQGNDLPYQHQDLALTAHPLIYSNLEVTLKEKAAPILNQWVEVALQVQSIAEEHEGEFWPDW